MACPDTLVGVAITVALVPPLCAAGIALVKNHFDIALGATVLFITNLLAIVLGAVPVFRLFDLNISLRGSRAPSWVRGTMVALGVTLLPVARELGQRHTVSIFILRSAKAQDSLSLAPGNPDAGKVGRGQ